MAEMEQMLAAQSMLLEELLHKVPDKTPKSAFIDKEDLCIYLNMSRPMLDNLVKNNLIPYIQILDLKGGLSLTSTDYKNGWTHMK